MVLPAQTSCEHLGKVDRGQAAGLGFGSRGRASSAVPGRRRKVVNAAVNEGGGGGNSDDVVRAIQKALTHEIGKVRSAIKEETARLEARAEGLEGEVRKIGKNMDDNFRVVKNIVISLEDHAGRTAESRLRERATDELWRSDSAKGRQKTFKTLDELIEQFIATPKVAEKKALLGPIRTSVIQSMEAEGAIEATVIDLLQEVKERYSKEVVPSAHLANKEMELGHLCELVGKTIGELYTSQIECPRWITNLLESFTTLGRNLNNSKDAALLDWEKGPGLAILIHSVVSSGLPGVKELTTLAGKEGERGGDNEKGAGSGRLEWRRQIEIDMVGCVEERGGGLGRWRQEKRKGVSFSWRKESFNSFCTRKASPSCSSGRQGGLLQRLSGTFTLKRMVPTGRRRSTAFTSRFASGSRL
ncbi:hypothetical protein KFL_000580340 [Klebsormidium nitens]|uniref:Uncharacterized protein n=1 Tax=Klebsormidium nitens TaxID=105231 RepID=A0A1Y1HTY1_KLENI|nr:hypothetical protein KFL_000580340 [Klebsormidium nitens]|eukprot:GAQ80639.1 hypothetical protein KFL_000580340 [Klebsormidium nitens]